MCTRILLAILASVCISNASSAQTTPEKTMKLALTLTPSDYSGGNGAAVVWHPVQKKYYTARAGNIEYPLDVFNASGKRISDSSSTTMIDLRGMWYNPGKKLLYANGYSNYGWSTYQLDKKGIPTGVTNIADGKNQPDNNSVGCFDEQKSLVYFLDGGSIYSYNATTARKTSEVGVVNLLSGIKNAYSNTDGEEFPSFYNPTPIYTGIYGKEFGLLNTEKKQIDLYSVKTGERTLVLHLPPDAGTPAGTFNFAYANGMYFIYDKEDKAWKGYK